MLNKASSVLDVLVVLVNELLHLNEKWTFLLFRYLQWKNNNILYISTISGQPWAWCVQKSLPRRLYFSCCSAYDHDMVIVLLNNVSLIRSAQPYVRSCISIHYKKYCKFIMLFWSSAHVVYNNCMLFIFDPETSYEIICL